MRSNRTIYENHLSIDKISSAIDTLKKNGHLEEINALLVKQIMTKATKAVQKDILKRLRLNQPSEHQLPSTLLHLRS